MEKTKFPSYTQTSKTAKGALNLVHVANPEYSSYALHTPMRVFAYNLSLHWSPISTCDRSATQWYVLSLCIFNIRETPSRHHHNLLFSFSFSSILAEAEARAMWVPKAAWKAMSSGSNATADHNYERERDTRFELVTQRQNQAP